MDFESTESAYTPKAHKHTGHVSCSILMLAEYHVCNRRNILASAGATDPQHGEEKYEKLRRPGKVPSNPDSIGMLASFPFEHS